MSLNYSESENRPIVVSTIAYLAPAQASDFLRRFDIVIAFLLIIFVPVIVLANGFVITSVFVFKRLRHHDNYLVCSLAFADLLVGMITCPAHIGTYLALHSFFSSRNSCLFLFASMVLGCGASLHNLLLIAIDRYIAIVYPFRYLKLKSLMYLYIALALMWTYVTVLSAVPFMGVDNFDDRKKCNIYEIFPIGYVIWVDYGMVGLSTLVPLVLYIKIYFIIRSHKLQISIQRSSLTPTDNSFQQDVKFAKISAIIFLIFILFWSPYFLRRPLESTNLERGTVESIQKTSILLALANSMVNPFVYVCTRQDFKIAFKLMQATRVCRWPGLFWHNLSRRTTQFFLARRFESRDQRGTCRTSSKQTEIEIIAI